MRLDQKLNNRRILLGISGGIASYKMLEVIRRLREHGAEVRVVMTSHAKSFVTPLSFQAISGSPVHDDLFDPASEAAMGHIELARWAELLLIAPATANVLAKCAHGIANDLLSTLYLATTAPVMMAPAMNQQMWQHVATQQNVGTLLQRGVSILEPGVGGQACGEVGPGRLMEVTDIVNAVLSHFETATTLRGMKILVTAGPTKEPIDPVRYISNHSSGLMGYSIAAAAQAMGGTVTLVSGPVALPNPPGVSIKPVQTAKEMYDVVMSEVKDAAIFISVAAVSDYGVAHPATQKIKKESDTLTLTLARNPDIISAVSALPNRPWIVGFAAETDSVLEYARKKRVAKKMDMMIANQVGDQLGMNQPDNAVSILSDQGEVHWEALPKPMLATLLMKKIIEHYEAAMRERSTV